MEDKTERRIALGDSANRVLGEEAFELAFESIRAELVTQWAYSKRGEEQQRELIWSEFQAAQRFKERLTTMMETGKIEKFNLDADKQD